jgi:hypothetical protein
VPVRVMWEVARAQGIVEKALRWRGCGVGDVDLGGLRPRSGRWEYEARAETCQAGRDGGFEETIHCGAGRWGCEDWNGAHILRPGRLGCRRGGSDTECSLPDVKTSAPCYATRTLCLSCARRRTSALRCTPPEKNLPKQYARRTAQGCSSHAISFCPPQRT